MFFKKNKNSIECECCGKKVSKSFTYCPYCGDSLYSEEDELRDFGMIGKNDLAKEEFLPTSSSLGIADKIFSNIFNSLMKTLDKQIKSSFESDNAEVVSLPNGIKIQFGHQKKPSKKNKENPEDSITSEQIRRMSALPKAQAKTSIKRLSDKILYELDAPGINSKDDIFVSKLENGYEIKAIGAENVYINNLPIELPIKGFSFTDKKLILEFNTEETQQ